MNTHSDNERFVDAETIDALQQGYDPRVDQEEEIKVYKPHHQEPAQVPEREYPDQLTALLKGSPTGFYKMWLNAFKGVSAVSDEIKLIAALSLQAQALGGLTFKHGHKDMNTNMYFMAIAQSGEGKSTTLDWVNSFNHLIPGLARIGSNFTAEAIEQKLADNPRLFIGIDEYQEFSDTSNKSYGGGLRSFLTSVYSGTLFPSLRKERLKEGESSDPIDVNVNILAMTTYEWLGELDYSAFRSGELARWIVVASPGSDERIPMPQPVDKEDWTNIMKWVKAFSEKCYGTAVFTPEAELVIHREYNALMDRIEAMPKHKEDIFIALARRLDVSARKLAVLLECNDNPRACPQIKAENVEAAYKVINNILSMYEMKIDEGLFGTPEQVAAFKVIRHLQEHGESNEIELQAVTEMNLQQTNNLLKAMSRSAKIEMHRYLGGVEVYRLYNTDKQGGRNVK